MPQEDQSKLFIDGHAYTMDDLSFREQRRMREFIRELAPDGDVDQASQADIVPALICVVKQRDDKEFTLDRALDFKPADLEAPEGEDPTPGE